jgi:hypothetical protein
MADAVITEWPVRRFVLMLHSHALAVSAFGTPLSCHPPPTPVTLSICLNKQATKHACLFSSMLGTLYSSQGKLGEAEQMYERALRGKEEALGVASDASFADNTHDRKSS